MLQYMAKVFMMQFPLYSGPKQAGQRNEEVRKNVSYISILKIKNVKLMKFL